jgi:hypothetical protein
MFAALIIVILLSIWVTKESVKIQPLPEERNASPQVITPEQNMFPDYVAQSPATSERKSAITIIKPAPKEKPVPDLTQESEEIRASATPTTSQIDNKHPSEIESKEMNQRGIVMW